MKLAMIGLGKMGGNMTTRLLRAGIQVVGFDRSTDVVNQLAEKEGMIAASSVPDAVSKLGDGKEPKIVWLMLPSGSPTEIQIQDLAP
ncbi:MAG: NAD(P)-binding domain-containing protein, partial [Methylophilaceae bacterium]